MKVILTEDLHSLGTIGDIVQVKDGYARNYLLPRQLAVLADEKNKRQLEHHMRILEKRKAEVLAEAKKRAGQIEGISVTVEKQVGEDERIFGSVTSAELELKLKEQGIEIPRKLIHILDEVKKVGVYHAEVKLHSEVTAKFKVWVVAQQ